MLIPSTSTQRLTRAYTSTLNTSQVFHKHNSAVLFGKRNCSVVGYFLHRHKTPLTRRFVVYYCSALYTRIPKLTVPVTCFSPSEHFPYRMFPTSCQRNSRPGDGM